ncbi:hypothetical protein NP233_g3680 [Leucocoprinus birnbaumii]|uniref:DRBM domain-containing protein n=1 Tax=Leucocoprinus birnbaumii TaxID=56174 RepID=A0AAD5VW39_9AGAR|nr:hypothetical protein NP233_g3680 [Leucocoprinus birnbaumii]
MSETQKPFSYVTRLHNCLGRLGNGEEKEISYVESYVGPEHAPTWTVKCNVKGEQKGVGTGTSKGKAREEASRNALEAMGFDPNPSAT